MKSLVRRAHDDLAPIKCVEGVPCTGAVHVRKSISGVSYPGGALDFGLGPLSHRLLLFSLLLGGCGFGIVRVHHYVSVSARIATERRGGVDLGKLGGKVEVERIWRARARRNLWSARSRGASCSRTWYIVRPPMSTRTTAVSYCKFILAVPSRRSTSCIADVSMGPKTACRRARAPSGAGVSLGSRGVEAHWSQGLGHQGESRPGRGSEVMGPSLHDDEEEGGRKVVDAHSGRVDFEPTSTMVAKWGPPIPSAHLAVVATRSISGVHHPRAPLLRFSPVNSLPSHLITPLPL